MLSNPYGVGMLENKYMWSWVVSISDDAQVVLHVHLSPCPPLCVLCIFFHFISLASPCCPVSFRLPHPLPLSPALLLILSFSFDIHA